MVTFIRKAPETDLAGYSANLKAGHRMSGVDGWPDIGLYSLPTVQQLIFGKN